MKATKTHQPSRTKLFKMFLPLDLLCLLALALLIFVFRIVPQHINFTLNGDTDITLQLAEEYQEPGFTASLFHCDLATHVTITSDLDVNKVGKFTITYTLSFLRTTHTLERHLTVVDSVSPVLTLNGETEIELTVGEDYEEPGATAQDNYDGDITENIAMHSNVDTATAGEYQVTYSVRDSSGNEATATRTVIIVQPVIYVPPEPVVYNLTTDDLTRYIQEHGYDVSVGYYNLATGKSYFYQPDTIHYGASLGKTLDALYLYDNNLVTDELKPYLSQAISVSDNAAHRYLVDYIGHDNFQSYGQSLGAALTLADENPYFSDTTVYEQLYCLQRLYYLTSVNPEISTYFLNYNHNYLSVGGLTVIHKYGYYGRDFHDVGIVLDSQPYIVIILTNHGPSAGPGVIRDLSNLLYRFHNSP